MTEFAVRNVEDDFVFDLRPVSTVRKENKLSCRVNKMLDQPRTCDPVDLDFFTGNPFHGLAMRRSRPSPASHCSAKHRRGRELLALRLRSSACFAARIESVSCSIELELLLIVRCGKRGPRPVAIRDVEQLRTGCRVPKRKAQFERHRLCRPCLRLHRYSDQSAR